MARASYDADQELRQEPRQELRELAREAKALFKSADKKLHDLISDLNARRESDLRDHLDPVAAFEIDRLRADHQAPLTARLAALLARLSSLPEDDGLEPDLRRLIAEVQTLAETADSLSADLNAPFVRSGEQEDKEGSSLDYAEKMAAVIGFYYLPRSATVEEEEDRFSAATPVEADLWRSYGWLRLNRAESGPESTTTSPTCTASFEVRVRAAARRRRRESVRARRHGNRSLLDCVVVDRTIGGYTAAILAQDKAGQAGAELSRRAAETLYVAAGEGWSRRRFTARVRRPLTWLDEKGRTPVLTRVRSVIEAAAEHIGPVVLPSGPDRPSPEQGADFDRILSAVVREAVRLEAIASFPGLSGDFLSRAREELKTYDKALDECDAAVGRVGARVEYLKAMHVLVARDHDGEAEKVRAFEDELRRIVATYWADLDDGYIPS